MTYSEMLHDLLEGSLPSAREETLFHALAADDDLRFEFKALLKMRDAVRDDDRAMAVPFSSTAQIFSRLGYMAPGVGAGAAAGSGAAAFFRTFGTHTAAVVLGIVLASSWFLWGDGNRREQTGSIATTSQTVQQTPLRLQSDGGNDGMVLAQSSPSGSGAVPSLSGSEATSRTPLGLQSGSGNRGSRIGAIPATIASSNANPATSNQASNAATSNLTSVRGNDSAAFATEIALQNQESEFLAQVSTSITDVQLRQSPDGPTVSGPDSSLGLGHSSLISSSAVAPAATGRSFRPDLRLGLRVVAPVHLTKPSQPLPTEDNMNNVTASLVVRGFSQNFAAVIEAGRESYVQKFDQLKSDGRIFHVEQAPSVLWGGIGVRYAAAPESTFNPFVQGMIGGSEGGPLVRSMVGLDWQFSRSAGLTFGVDYSLLTFAFQDRTWYSQRIGVGGGVTFRLMED
ncbi:MAG: hypothetical protein IT211_10825 [Armatimonadetes bacterium]|nr:hypothetical protein [Armatimonadota bacterium]